MAADKRSYSAGHFMLSLDGEPAILKDFDGGNIKGEVVTHNMGPENLAMKHISTLKFEPFTINVGMSMGNGLYQWIKQSLDKAHVYKNGYIVAGSFDYKAMEYRYFQDALITEFTVPALDASSKDSAYFTLKFDPVSIEQKPGDNADLKGTVNTKQKKWLLSNFRFRLGDLPCTKVTKIDSFTIKQTVIEDAVGEFRTNDKIPGKLEAPNLKVTISSIDQAPWAKWFEEFVIRGENGQEKELTGSIEFLDPSGKEVLGSVDLFQVGIFGMQNEKLEANADKVKRFVVELYVEKYGLTLNYV